MVKNMIKGERILFDRAGLTLECFNGILWITWPSSGDILVCGGESRDISTHGKISVTAMTDSVVNVIYKYSLHEKIIRRLRKHKSGALSMAGSGNYDL